MLCLLYQSFWLFTKTATGKILGLDKGEGEYDVVDVMNVSYVVGEKEYTDFFLRNGVKDTARQIQIEYFAFRPEWSRIDSFTGNWGMLIAVGAFFFISLTIIFLTPGLIPQNATFLLSKRFPFFAKIEIQKARKE
jgi:hypothetical protein